MVLSKPWLLKVFNVIDVKKKGKIGHPEVTQFIKRHPTTASRLGFLHYGAGGVPHEATDPKRQAYRRRFAELTLSDPNAISLDEFLGAFGQGKLKDPAARQGLHVHQLAQRQAWFEEVAGGAKKITLGRLRSFLTSYPERAAHMGFASTSADGATRIFNNMNLDGNGSIDQPEFLAYFGFGPLAAASAKVERKLQARVGACSLATPPTLPL